MRMRKMLQLFRKHNVHYIGPENQRERFLKDRLAQINHGESNLIEGPLGLVLSEDSVRIIVLHPIKGSETLIHMLIDKRRTDDRLKISISGLKNRASETNENAAHRHIRKVIRDHPYKLVKLKSLSKQISGIRWLDGLPHEDHPNLFAAILSPDEPGEKQDCVSELDDDQHEKSILGKNYDWRPISNTISHDMGVKAALVAAQKPFKD